jgi:hypothetical protein
MANKRRIKEITENADDWIEVTTRTTVICDICDKQNTEGEIWVWMPTRDSHANLCRLCVSRIHKKLKVTR